MTEEGVREWGGVVGGMRWSEGGGWGGGGGGE